MIPKIFLWYETLRLTALNTGSANCDACRLRSDSIKEYQMERKNYFTGHWHDIGSSFLWYAFECIWQASIWCLGLPMLLLKTFNGKTLRIHSWEIDAHLCDSKRPPLHTFYSFLCYDFHFCSCRLSTQFLGDDFLCCYLGPLTNMFYLSMWNDFLYTASEGL